MTPSERVERLISVTESQDGRVDKRALLVAEHLLDKNRKEIQRADEKVSMLVVGASPTGVLIVQWTGRHVARISLTGQWLVGMGLAIWLVALILLAVVVYPRVGTKQEGCAVTYFADVRRTADISVLRQYVRQAAEDRLSWLLVQVTDTSGIVAAKYRCLRVAIGLFGLSGALVCVGVVL
jgi:type IV secretory pathway TrbD component